MSFRIRVRKGRGVWWWTTSVSRPLSWQGPWCTKAEAFTAARTDIRERSDGRMLGHRHVLRPADLRQMAWIDYPELRHGG